MLVASQIDSANLFSSRSVGADAEMSGLAATLAAHLAMTQLPSNIFQKNTLFAYFEGEAFGYVGSTRFAQDITNFTCESYGDEEKTWCAEPLYQNLDFEGLKFEQITHVIELKQVGSKSAAGLYVHQHNHDLTTDLARIVTSPIMDKITLFPASNATPGIPPSSSMTFLKQNPALIPNNVVITDHGALYANKYIAI